MDFIQSYFTDIGTVRRTNQDSLAIYKAATDFGMVILTVVCDGMGGHSSGELASKYCITRLGDWLKREFPRILYEGKADGIWCPNYLHLKLEQEVKDINFRLAEYGWMNYMQLGSTLTALLIVEEHYYIAHVGDSRCYLLSSESLRKLTRDQSVVAYEVEQGRLTPEEARHDRRINQLRECMGITPNVNMEFYDGPVPRNSTFLLCSDGFWHHLGGEELVRYLAADSIKNSEELQMRLRYLTEQVKQRGERDNITSVAVIPQ